LNRKEDIVGARSKLNGAYLNGALLIAGTAGILSGSWSIFGIALAGLLASSIISGSIRLPSSRRR
jgi:hypothetical protein